MTPAACLHIGRGNQGGAQQNYWGSK